MNSPTPMRSQQGSAAVELGILLIFLVLVLAGIVEFGRAFWYYDALSKATRDGASLMSQASRASVADGSAISDAMNRVLDNANAARLNPALASSQVSVTCLDGSFRVIACDSSGTAPVNVRVSITGYNINIGGMVPFLSPTGGGATRYSGVALAPSTTMPFRF